MRSLWLLAAVLLLPTMLSPSVRPLRFLSVQPVPLAVRRPTSVGHARLHPAGAGSVKIVVDVPPEATVFINGLATKLNRNLPGVRVARPGAGPGIRLRRAGACARQRQVRRDGPKLHAPCRRKRQVLSDLPCGSGSGGRDSLAGSSSCWMIACPLGDWRQGNPAVCRQRLDRFGWRDSIWQWHAPVNVEGRTPACPKSLGQARLEAGRHWRFDRRRILGGFWS